MSNYNKLINNLEELKLLQIRDNIDKYIELINNKDKTVVDALYELSNLEVELERKKKILHSIQFAGFPYMKGFDDFDFNFQPSINKDQILDFKNLRFVEKAENILFLGNPRSRKNTFINSNRTRECTK